MVYHSPQLLVKNFAQPLDTLCRGAHNRLMINNETLYDIAIRAIGPNDQHASEKVLLSKEMFDADVADDPDSFWPEIETDDDPHDVVRTVIADNGFDIDAMFPSGFAATWVVAE